MRARAAAIAALLLATGILGGGGAEAAKLDTHTVQLDGTGKIVPWTPDPADGYDHVIGLAMGAVPEWAPAGENHIVHSTSVVRSVTYAPTGDAVAYTTFDAGSRETLRLAFTPASVRAGGAALPQRADLALQGWVFDAATGVLRIRHDAAAAVQVVAGTPGNTPPEVELNSPADGASFEAPGPVMLAATASDADGTVARIDFYDGTTLLGSDTTGPFEVAWTDLDPGAYDVVAFARDDGGAVTASAPARITVTAPVSLPPPWQSADVGDVAAAGAASYYDGTFTVTGSGADIWNQADEFHFVHQPRSGDFEIAARVASVGDTGPWAMAGVMIRDGLAPDARHGIVSMTRAQGWSFTWREASGGASTYEPGGAGSAPAWVKLRRVGNELTALRSSNGTSWTAFARATVAMPSQVHVGLAVSAVSDGALNTSTFDGVAIGDPTGGQVPDVTVDPSITYQEIDGFGVNANHRSWRDGELAPVLDALIDEAGMTLFRVVFDNADWEAVNDDADPDTMNQAYYDALYGSAAFAPLWNMAAHLNQRGITGGLVFNFMGPGPDWMGGATLAAGMEDEWAEMIVSLLVYARTVRGLAFGLVAPNNEPDIFNEGIHTTDAAQYATALHALAERLDAAGLGDVRFVAPDRAGGGTAYMPELLADPVVMAKLAHLGVHSYSDGGGGSAGVRDFLLASDYPDRSFWMTEFNVWCPTCDSGTRGTYDWSYTRGTADYLLDHLENGASAGIVWEGYDSFYAHPPSTWSYWGLLGIDDIDVPASTYTPRKNFYTVAQVSRFVRAGDVRVDVRTSVSGLRLLAFSRPSTGGITIVGTNDSAQARTLTVDVSGLPGVTALQLVETTSSRSLDYGSSRSESGGQVEVAVAGDSVFTLTSEPIGATASCPDAPSACRPPTVSGASRLKIRNRTRDEQDRLSWTWTRGQATARDDLGEPTSRDAYDLCIYDAGALIAGLIAPAGGVCGGSPTRPRACWRENAKGLDYKDTSLTPNGVQKVGLRAGTDGRAAAALTGKGSNLRLPDLAGIRGPLAVQLRRHDGGLCLGATFSAPFGQHDANTLTVRSD